MRVQPRADRVGRRRNLCHLAGCRGPRPPEGGKGGVSRRNLCHFSGCRGSTAGAVRPPHTHRRNLCHFSGCRGRRGPATSPLEKAPPQPLPFFRLPRCQPCGPDKAALWTAATFAIFQVAAERNLTVTVHGV